MIFGFELTSRPAPEQKPEARVERGGDEAAIKTIVTNHAIGLHEVETFCLGLQQAVDNGLGRKLLVSIDHPDIGAVRRIEPHAHAPSYHPFLRPDDGVRIGPARG
jgi:hypothetical protein